MSLEEQTLNDALRAFGYSSQPIEPGSGRKAIYDHRGQFVGNLTAFSAWALIRKASEIADSNWTISQPRGSNGIQA